MFSAEQVVFLISVSKKQRFFHYFVMIYVFYIQANGNMHWFEGTSGCIKLHTG